MRCILISATLLLAACGPRGGPDDECRGLDLDADGDGICDGADACPLDPDNDADGDGVCAPDDPCPLDAPDDSDGDGVCDSEDPCPFDPLDDSDGDGVCDSDDLCPGGDDRIDTDGDGVPDDCDACPLDPEVSEGEEECDTGEPPCSYVDVPSSPAVRDEGVFTPEYLGVRWSGIVNQSAIEDFVVDGVPQSAWLEFSFYDADFNYQCAVLYDLSVVGAAIPSTAAWTLAAPVELWEAWDLFPYDGHTNCGEFSHSSFPDHDDPRTMLESIQWALGLGPMHALEAQLQADPAYADDWALDYAPYVFSMYVGYNRHAPVEAGFVFGFERTCDTLELDQQTGERILATRPTEGPLSGAYQGFVYYLLPL